MNACLFLRVSKAQALTNVSQTLYKHSHSHSRLDRPGDAFFSRCLSLQPTVINRLYLQLLPVSNSFFFFLPPSQHPLPLSPAFFFLFLTLFKIPPFSVERVAQTRGLLYLVSACNIRPAYWITAWKHGLHRAPGLKRTHSFSTSLRLRGQKLLSWMWIATSHRQINCWKSPAIQQ